MSRPEKTALWLAASAAVGLALLLSAANFWLGNLNQDEGWYLYAALEYADGRLPYLDFFFTQGPLLPLAYGWLAPLWAPWGVAGGRLLTALLGLAGGVCAAALAARALPVGRKFVGALLVWLLTCGSVYHSYFTVLPKTYALASLLLSGGFLALASLHRAPGALAALAGLLIALAAGTRISLGVALAVTGVWLLWNRGRLGRAWLWFGVGGAGGLAAIYGPFVLAAPEAFRFANSFHAARDAGNGLLFVAGSLSRCARGYLPLALLSGVAALFWLGASCRGRAENNRKPRSEALPSWPRLWLLAFLAVFGVHLLSPYPYDDYQVPIMPLLAAVVAVRLLEWPFMAALSATRMAWGALWLAGLAAFTSPLNQDWFVIRQDRFWAVTKPKSDLARLREVGRRIRAMTPPDKPLLTQDTYLAVESGRRVPAGFEMGPFGYFPDLDDTRATRYHVLNRRGLKHALMTTDAPLAAFSGYAFGIRAPTMRKLPDAERSELWNLVKLRYARVTDDGVIHDFGQHHTELTLWKLRNSNGGSLAPQ